MTPAQLRAFRKRVRLTQAGLAARLQLGKRNIEYYERGDKAIPRWFALACLALETEITTYGG